MLAILCLFFSFINYTIVVFLSHLVKKKSFIFLPASFPILLFCPLSLSLSLLLICSFLSRSTHTLSFFILFLFPPLPFFFSRLLSFILFLFSYFFVFSRTSVSSFFPVIFFSISVYFFSYIIFSYFLFLLRHFILFYFISLYRFLHLNACVGEGKSVQTI